MISGPENTLTATIPTIQSCHGEDVSATLKPIPAISAYSSANGRRRTSRRFTVSRKLSRDGVYDPHNITVTGKGRGAS